MINKTPAKDQERLEKSTLKIPNAIGIAADIRNTNDVKNVVNKTVEKFGKLDILVNNAGIFPKIKQLHEIDEDEWNEVLDVNLTGQFAFTKFCFRQRFKSGILFLLIID